MFNPYISHQTSWELPYVLGMQQVKIILHEVFIVYQHTFILGSHDATSKSNLYKFEEVLRLFEVKAHGGLRCGWILCWELTFVMSFSNFDILVSCHYILSASNNVTLMNDHLLHNFINIIGQPYQLTYITYIHMGTN